ncbi:MAG: insulinase family protein [Sebaldella sp.]|nr:insulinase family protein [Sebaldella sp.]
MKQVKNRKLSYLLTALLLNILIFFTISAEVEVKTDINGYKYETVKNNEDLGRLYTLPNGLKIYLVQNKLRPQIETRIVVGSGSKNDPDTNTGLAHYLEHMMFKGNEKIGTVNWEAEKPYIDKITNLYESYKSAKTTKEKERIYSEIDKLSSEAAKYVAPNELSVIVQSLGGSGYNAYTTNDETVYVLSIPSNELEKWVRLERTRFGGLVLRLFHTELETVYEEFNKNQDNDFFWVINDVNKKLYSGHPYGEKTTIGRPEDLKNPSMKAIMGFYNQYYVANNMAMILSGDFDYDKTIKIISENWSDFRQNKNLTFKEYTAKDFNKIAVDEVYGKQTEFVAIAYRFNGEIDQVESVKLGLLTEVLQNDKAGLFDINISQKQKLLSVDKVLMSNKDYTTLMLVGVPKQGQSLEDAKNTILTEIDNLKKGNFNNELVESIMNNVKLGREVARDNNAYLVERFRNMFINGKSLDSVITAENQFDSLTKDDIIQFANEKFKDNYVVVYKKSGENNLKVSVDKPKITPLELNSNNRSEFAKKIMNEKVKDIAPKFLDYKKDMKSFKLNNKNDVFYIKNDTSKIFKLAYVIDRGSYNDKELRTALDYLDYLGTDKYAPEAFGEELYKYALNLNIDLKPDYVTIVLSGLDSSFDKGVELLQDHILNSKADKEIYDNYIDDILKGRMEVKKNKGAATSAAINYVTYGAKNPFNSIITNEELKQLNPEDLVKKIKDLSNYKHEVFYFGPREMSELKKPLNNKLEVKNPKVIEKSQKYVEQDMDTNKVYYANYEGVQNDILILTKEGKFNLENLPYSMVFGSLYSEGLSSIPFQKLREEKALAYTAYSYINVPDNKEKSYYLISYIGTQADKTNDAISSFMDLLNNFVVTEDQFNKSKDLILKSIENQRILKDDIYQSYLTSKKMGLGTDPREYVYNNVKSMTYDDFRNFFKNNIENKKYNIVIVGKKENILKSNVEKYGTLKELSLEELFGY